MICQLLDADHLVGVEADSDGAKVGVLGSGVESSWDVRGGGHLNSGFAYLDWSSL